MYLKFTLYFISDGYTTEDVVFLWKEGDPVQITSKLNLSRFTLLKYFTAYCTSKTNTGAYSCIKVDMLFKREFSYYLILIYVPCCMLVIVSWVNIHSITQMYKWSYIHFSTLFSSTRTNHYRSVFGSTQTQPLHELH